MSNLALLAICFGMGVLLRKTERLPENTTAVLNAFIIHVSVPALTILSVHNLKPDAKLIYPILMAWVLFALGVGFYKAASRFHSMSDATLGALILTGAMGNTAFVGLPMIEAFYGKEGLPIGILADQMGTFLVLSTLGIVTAARLSGSDISNGTIVKRIVLFPPFQSLLAGVLLIPMDFPFWAEDVLSKLGATLPPLALLSVGFALRLSHIRGQEASLAIGLLYKLIVGPAALYLLFIVLLGADGLTAQVTIFEAAMPPMIVGGIVAMEYGLNPRLAALMVGVGIPLSFATLSVWSWILQGV
ncbi:MAG: AEC family transporter [Nitrospinae bacterium]|nr:AEC family transporter [Nitrospinota bacterium]